MACKEGGGKPFFIEVLKQQMTPGFEEAREVGFIHNG